MQALIGVLTLIIVNTNTLIQMHNKVNLVIYSSPKRTPNRGRDYMLNLDAVCGIKKVLEYEGVLAFGGAIAGGWDEDTSAFLWTWGRCWK